MRPWIRYSHGQLVYTGRGAKKPFQQWVLTPAGRRAIEAVAEGLRFSLFGRLRAARRRVWHQLAAAAADVDVVATVGRETQAYLRRIGEMAYADGLPRVGVELHRLVVVPRVLLNAETFRAIEHKLLSQPSFASVEGGPAVREFFILRLIEDMMAAVTDAGSSPRRPLPAGGAWTSVGVNRSFVWRMPLLEQPPWAGHHYVIEQNREPMTRTLRKLLGTAIDRFEATLPTLSRLERDDILRRAAGHR